MNSTKSNRRTFLKQTAVVVAGITIVPRHVLGKGFVPSDTQNIAVIGDGVAQMIKWFDKGKIGAVSHVDVWTNRPVWLQGIVPKKDIPPLLEGLDWNSWIGPAQMVDYRPQYHPFKWRGWWNFGTGALGDMGCHLIDPPYRVLGLGYPMEVESSVGAVFERDWDPEHLPDSCPPSSRTQLKFNPSKKNPKIVKMTWTDGGLRPFRPDLIPDDHPIGSSNSANGMIMYGKKGIMTCGVYGRQPKLYLNDGAVKTFESKRKQKLPGNGHQHAWVEACKAGYGSKRHRELTSSFDYAGPLTETVLMGNLAIRSYALRKKNNKGKFYYPGRKKLIWDENNMKVTNYDPANQFVKRIYREGWTL